MDIVSACNEYATKRVGNATNIMENATKRNATNIMENATKQGGNALTS